MRSVARFCEPTSRPFERPASYDRREYELLARYLAAGWDEVFRKFDPIRGDKVDMRAARHNGVHALGALWGYGTEEELLAAGAHRRGAQPRGPLAAIAAR